MTAHPDDENNSALALYARYVGAQVALVTATRGDGGQNEIEHELSMRWVCSILRNC